MVLKDTSESIPASAAEETVHPQKPSNPENSPSAESTEEDGLDFVVTEANDQDPEMVGGFKSNQAENLGIESPAELMQAEAGSRKDEPRPRPNRDSYFAVPEPEAPAASPTPVVPPASAEQPTDAKAAGPSRDKIERLSDEQLKEISRRMRAESKPSDYLTDEEKQQLISAIGHDPATDLATSSPARGTGFDNEPIVPPKRSKENKPSVADLEISGDSPRISKRTRGVAYFAKGYIRVTGQQELHEGDEMLISGREYVLRQKRFSSKTIAIAVTAVACLIVFALAALFSSSAQIGDGRVVGVVLGADGNPILTGGEVRFPELGRAFEVNGQGFFKTDPLAAGSYQLQYVSGETVLAQDYATVADDNLTTVTLKPAAPQASIPTEEISTPSTTPSIESSSPAAPEMAQESPAPARPAAANPNAAKPSSNGSFAKLTLAANVDGAKLTIDGAVMGAGNLTYTRLKPGLHTYTVSREGYQTVNGTVDLGTEKPTSLEVKLAPTAAESPQQARAELEYYQAAASALDRKDYSTALTDLTRAVEANPSYAEAYAKRGDVYRSLNNAPSAHDDYVRAAEIYKVRNDYGQALTAYAGALKANPKSIPALLGRGSLYLARNEAIAAIADFDMVTRIDKRNLDAYIGLGRARYNQGTFDKATKHFKDARSLDANNPVIHQYLMLSHFGEGEFKEAQKDYDKFVKCASEAQVQQLIADPKFSPVMRVIEH